MFKKVLIILSLLLPGAALHAQEQYASLDSLMDVYVMAIRHEAPDAKEAEVDYMIGAASDSATRRHIALHLFDYYKESRLMGEEAVAIHIYDRWFKDGSIPMRSEFDEMDAKLFVDFNRSSLLGMEAPQVTLKKPCGGRMTVPVKGRTAILWFFDTGCGKCRLEAQVLPTVLAREATLPVNFYAVYAGQSKKEWREFRRSFKVPGRNVKVIHLWDPEIDSDYLRLYGVISTPRLFMVNSQGVIMGRRLEVENLGEMFRLASDFEDYLSQQQTQQ